jgi:hypothetical protein
LIRQKVVVNSNSVTPQSSVGSWQNYNGLNLYHGMVVPYNSTQLAVYTSGTSTSPTNPQIASSTGNLLFTDTQGNMTMRVSVPIAGWSSSVVMSSGFDSSVVSLSAYKNGGSVVANTAISNWTSVTRDSVGAFNATTGQYRVQVAGDYFVSFSSAVNGSGGGADTSVARILKNGSPIITGSQQTTSINKQVFGLIPNCKASDILTVDQTANDPFPANNTDVYLSIFKLSGNQTIAASGSVNAKYYLSANQAVSANSVILFNSKSYDSTNSYNSTTGLYTCPENGKYRIGGVGFTTSGTTSVYVVQNGTSLDYIYGANASNVVSGYSEINCLAGDTFGIYSNAAVTFAQKSGTINATYLIIERIGN